MILAITRVQTMEKVMARCLVNISGPGMITIIKKPPSKIAIAPLPGTPNATVGINSPPSYELLAAPGPNTPRMSPLPKPSRSLAPLALCTACAYAIHCATPPPARHNTDEDSNGRAAKDQPKMAKRILDSLYDAGLQVFRLSFTGDRCAAHREVDDFRDGKDANQYRHDIESVPKIHHAHIKSQ